MFRTKWLQPLLLLAATSCSTGRNDDFCLIAHPIHPAATDISAMSDGLVQQILAHDLTGQKLCGWAVR